MEGQELKRTPLDTEFIKNDGRKEEEKQDYSFLSLYRFSTGLDKLLLTLGLLAAIGTGLLQPINPVIFGALSGDIIHFAIVTGNPASTEEEKEAATDILLDSIRFFAIVNSLIGVGTFILSYIFTETFNYSAMRQVFKIRSMYLRTVLNQDIAWYDLHQTGDFASRMSDDLAKLEDGIGEKVPLFFSFQVVFIVSLAVALFMGWKLALICLISLPASGIALGTVALLSSKLAKNELDAYADAGSISEEVFSSLKTVIAFGGYKKEIQRYDEKLLLAKNNNIKKSFLSAIGFGVLWFMIYGSYALAFWYGIRLVLDDRDVENPTYTPATMVTIFFSVMIGSLNFGLASPYIDVFGMAKAAGNKIFRVIDSIPTINLSKGKGETIDDLKGYITLKNVHFHYPSRKDMPVLQGLDLEMKSGETVALVGTSGCGKSTVLQLIQRFYDPNAGEIYLDGKNLKDLDLTWLRSQIGVVGQEPILFGTTIAENIKYGNPEASEADIIKAARRANADVFIKALPNGYRTLVGERGAHLSGGQKQRIAIARAMVRNPTILILDEATSALDYSSEAKVQAALDSASKGCTTIIVAHRLSTIRGANKIIVMSEGKVIEQGTHDELMTLKNEYYGLVTTQVQSSAVMEKVKKNDDKETLIDGEETDADTLNKRNESVLSQTDEGSNVEKSDSVIEVMKMNNPEWPYLLIGGIGALVMGCGITVFAILFGDILSTLAMGSPEEVRSEANRFCLYLVYNGIGCAIATFCQIYMFGVAGEKLTKRIRKQMFQAMLAQEVAYFDKKSNGVGALCARLSGDAANVQGATGQRIGTILQAIAALGLAIGISMYYEWRLGLVTLAFTPFVLLATFLERRNTTNLNDEHGESLQKSTKIAVEGVGNVRTVASLGCEEMFHQLYVSELIPHYKRSLRTTHWRSSVFGISRSLMFFAYSACMYYGGHLIKDGLPYENVFKVAQALIGGTVLIANGLAFTPNFTKGIEAAKKVRETLNRTPRIRDTPSSKDKKSVLGNMQYSNVHFTYPTRTAVPVLKGIDLAILQGKTVALVGSSGCGKSTIIQLAERFYDPILGDVILDEDDIRTIKLDSLRACLGIVSQEPNLFNKTISENIAYGDNSRTVSTEEVIDAARKANIHNFISGLPMGYETKVGEKGTQLSGGQKQRIAIARALVRNPKVLLLDEATSALDAESEKIVQEALDNAKKGRTCITIAHRLTTIQDADVICVIDNGVIAEMGTHAELLEKNGLYCKLYSIQHK